MTGTRVLLAALILAIGQANGAIIDVPQDYASIQDAIDAGKAYLPVADAGLPAYPTTIPVTLDGSGSTGPDGSGPLTYSWKQVSGPALTISDANSPRPTVSGFTQGTLPQWCRFELTVSDGQYTSLPDGVDVVVMPDPGEMNMALENASFDSNKPTVVYWGGGNCITGGAPWDFESWRAVANVISGNYVPDDLAGGYPTYDRCGDWFIGYLYRMDPHYRQPIQFMGHSTGGQPAMDAAKRINLVYHDARYAINRVTFLDARCRDFSADVPEYLASAVDGEQCWLDTYEGTGPYFFPSVLNARVTQNNHGFPKEWYRNSLTGPTMNVWNHGAVGGAYWSVVGPGKNLQLALIPGVIVYELNWTGTINEGAMDLMNEALYPGRLPQPVTLLGPLATTMTGPPMLTCLPSDNAVRYQLLMGPDPYRVMDFNVIAETPGPPDAVVTTLPCEKTWWTVRAFDAYGSSIYADPAPLTAFALSLPVTNATQGKRYGFIQEAIDDAWPGDEIVLSEGTYYEDVDFTGHNMTLRSLDPNSSAVVAATVLHGSKTGVTFSSAYTTGTLAGLTITGGTCGIDCSIASPSISRCRIIGVRANGIELRNTANPMISQCLIADNAGDGIAMFETSRGRASKYNVPTLTNCTIAYNGGAGLSGGMPILTNCIVYFNGASISGDAKAVTYTDIQGGWTGQGNLDADPLFAGDCHLQSAAGRWDSLTGAWVEDAATSPCIDAGDPVASVLDEPAPNGGRINLGAYGGTTEASRSP